MNKVLITAVLLCLFTGTLAAEDFNLSYDFRFRYEYTDDSGKADTRNRNRIRTRLGAKYSASEKLDLFVRFATHEKIPHQEIKHWELALVYPYWYGSDVSKI